ncbi:MAG: GNAT family N-acetyltransferase [Gaiellaceae bacterium]
MTMRAATEPDLEEMAALLAADESRLLGRPSHTSVTDLRQWLALCDLPTGTWLLEDGEGIAALGWSIMWGEAASAIGVVHPRAKGRGLGARILDCSEEWAAARAPRIQQIGMGADEAAARLFTARGYREVRRFYGMAIELTAPPEVPDPPIETFAQADGGAFHAALDEAFRDHWEHHPRSFEEWWELHSSAPDFDPSLWFLIRDGSEIAAVVRNEPNRNGGGYVGAIGVRRPWRGRGHAKALLLRTFREFWDRGVTRVTLGVDADSPTGATHLYERVGMHVEDEQIVFERALP